MVIAGVILAGGRGSRMGGADKALLRLAGAPLVDRAVARLAPQAGAVAISAAGDAGRFAHLGLPVLADDPGGWLGPLAGVLAGMDWAAGQGAAAIVTVAVDTPFFPDDLVRRLSGQGGLALAATREGGRLVSHPTFGLWPVGLRDDLRAALGQGMRKVGLWAGEHGARLVEFPDPRAFYNINRPEDLAVAEEMLA